MQVFANAISFGYSFPVYNTLGRAKVGANQA